MREQAFAKWLHGAAVAELAAAVFAMMESADRADLRDSEWGRLLPLWDRIGEEDKFAIAAAVERAAYDSLARLMLAIDEGAETDGGTVSLTLTAGGTALTGLWGALADARDAALAQ